MLSELKIDGSAVTATSSYEFTNVTSNHTIVAKFSPISYTISYNLDGGTASGNPASYTIESSAITLNNPTKDGYNFTGWTGTGLAEATTSVTIPTGSTGDRTYTANWEVAVTPANAPVLATGLTPVNWNGSAWETTTVANWDYNYNSVAEATHSTVAGNGDGKWANAQTADGSLYVWIPRYSYKITSGEHQNVDSWNSLDTPGTGKIEVKFSNGTTDDTSNSYIAHPAFTFGTDELQGIWVAKYNSSTETLKSMPGLNMNAELSVSPAFDKAYNLNRSLDSHLMKNSEWGAVTYLTNAIGRIPYINNSSSNITGNAGESQDTEKSSDTIPTYSWNTINGVKASTTHNIYGIYDMSTVRLGGEYVAAYVNNGSSALTSAGSSLVNSYTEYGTKYVDVYNHGVPETQGTNYSTWQRVKGDAIFETSSSGTGNNSWDGDSSYSPTKQSTGTADGPFFKRGGGGIFAFSCDCGNTSVSSSTYRVVLGIN